MVCGTDVEFILWLVISFILVDVTSLLFYNQRTFYFVLVDSFHCTTITTNQPTTSKTETKSTPWHTFPHHHQGAKSRNPCTRDFTQHQVSKHKPRPPNTPSTPSQPEPTRPIPTHFTTHLTPTHQAARVLHSTTRRAK